MIRMTEDKLSKLRAWEEKAYAILLKADERDLCARNEIIRDLNAIQEDIYLLKAMLSFKRDLPESKQAKYRFKLGEIFHRLEKKIEACEHWNTEQPQTAGQESWQLNLSKAQQEIEELSDKRTEFEEWFSTQMDEMTSDESDQINSLLNKLIYFEDRAASKYKTISESERFSKKELHELSQAVKKSRLYLSRLREVKRSFEKHETK